MDPFHDPAPPTKLKSAVMGEQSTKKTMTEEQTQKQILQKQRTLLEVDLIDLRFFRDCTELAREYAQEVLAIHDANLGRNTRINKLTAKGIEGDLRMIDRTIERLKNLDTL